MLCVLFLYSLSCYCVTLSSYWLVVYRLLLVWCCVCLPACCLLLSCWLLSLSVLYIGYLCAWCWYCLYAVYFVPAGLLVSYLAIIPLIRIYRFISLVLACYLTALILYHLATITALYGLYSCLSVLLVSYTIKHFWRVLISLHFLYLGLVLLFIFYLSLAYIYTKKGK